jgi:hypothetical protein
LVDGDYDLVGVAWANGSTRRTIRLFASGTFIEWAIDDGTPGTDAGLEHFRIDSPVTATGHTLQVTSSSCIGTLSDSFGYTATGDQLQLFNFEASALFTYQRTCVR